ncbi:uncharacterized protein A1O5_03256 [Cladophialophora psammophila CBS 110553]|uniref:CUE domain-containing protein n=1 Tax=Cladophialophora psammophila CBS 110553 TaxID=1182543 RepID=W9X842_9EURO|nr:uncharacterized protein A1O5_03256 [Cladophialophora psammophila CBS 110553]EXJ73495.1 hypothetical protein A1O5_03256 [Cladophialophora psammophila CBS 110553]
MPDGLPPLALYPEPNLQVSLPPAEWEACLDSWLFSLEFRLRLQDKDFSRFSFAQDASGVPFLASFFSWTRAGGTAAAPSSSSQKERILVKRAYLLLRRLLLVTHTPFDYDAAKLVDLLCQASLHYAAVPDWRATLKTLWKRDQSQLTHAVEDWKKAVSADLSIQPGSGALLTRLREMNAFVKVSPDAGLILMTGSDYLETLMETYGRLQTSPDAGLFQRLLTEHMFYSLRSLMSDGCSHGSLLLDHLYFMKSEADRLMKAKPNEPTLSSSLVCSTSFLRHLASDSSVTSSQRGQGLLESLSTYRQNTRHLHPPVSPKRRKSAKGKGKANVNEEMHVHKASQISQVHELFPDLSNQYILKLLDHFHDDTEAVVAALLEPDSLPSDLRDRGAFEGPALDIAVPAHDLAPHSTPPLLPERKNIFDGDGLDKLRISAGRLHRGRKDVRIDHTETEHEHAQRKAAIMSALAAFDSDDDERDDTYDIADVGGTVDSTLDADTRPQPERGPDQNPHEERLFRAWKDSQELFARDSKTRALKVRQDLKRETEMSDEQLEGWAIMLKKDPKLQDRLEKKYSGTQSFRGSQAALTSTRWRGDNTPEDSEGEAGSGGRRMEQAQIRGSRVWGRGRGGVGSTAGPSGDAATQAARRRKEQGRGRGGASHNRREGRARKMGRGMGGGGVQQ